MLVFSVIGYVMRKFGFPMAPIALTLVLGPQLETSLGQSLVMSEGSLLVLFRSPISTVLMLVAIGSVLHLALRPVTRKGVQMLRGHDSEV